MSIDARYPEVRCAQGSKPASRSLSAHPVASTAMLLFSCWIAAASAQAQLADEIFVPSPSNAVTIYPSDGNGSVAPTRWITGNSTGLDTPYSLAVDGVHQEIFVANFAAATVTVYDISDTGNVPPKRSLFSGGAPIALAVDWIHEEQLVLSYGATPVVFVFGRTASGSASPLRTLTGDTTGMLAFSRDLALDLVHDELVVGSSDGSSAPSVRVFSRTANGDVAPVRVISGAATGLVGEISGVEVDTVHGEIVVGGSFGIAAFSRTANGNVTPLRTLSGDQTGLDGGVAGLALDPARGEIVVASQFANALLIFARTASGNAPPLRTIAGNGTQLDAPTRIDVVSSLLFADGFGAGDACSWTLAVGGACT